MDDSGIFEDGLDWLNEDRHMMLYEQLGDELLLYEQTEDEDLLFEPHVDYELAEKVAGWQSLEITKLQTIQWILSQEFIERLIMRVNKMYRHVQKYRLLRWTCRIIEFWLDIAFRIYSKFKLPPFLIRLIFKIDSWIAYLFENVFRRRSRHDREAVVVGRVRNMLTERYGTSFQKISQPFSSVSTWWYGSEYQMKDGKYIEAEIIIENTNGGNYDKIGIETENDDDDSGNKASFLKRGVIYIISLPKSSFGLLYNMITGRMKMDSDFSSYDIHRRDAHNQLAKEIKSNLNNTYHLQNTLYGQDELQSNTTILREGTFLIDDTDTPLVKERKTKNRNTRPKKSSNDTFSNKSPKKSKIIDKNSTKKNVPVRPQKCDRFTKNHQKTPVWK